MAITRAWRGSLPAVIGLTIVSQAGCKGFVAAERGKSHMIVPVPFAPPPPKHEETTNKSKPGHIWVGGYWEWLEITGTYRWRPGHFVKARRNWEYRRAAYKRKNGRWYYIRPHWRRRQKRALPPAPTSRTPAGSAIHSPPPAKKKKRLGQQAPQTVQPGPARPETK